MPMPIAKKNIDIVEPMPYFLPSSTVKAEAAGMESAALVPWMSNTVSSCPKLLVRGITASNMVKRMLPRMMRLLLLYLSAIRPPRGANRIHDEKLIVISVPMRVVLKPIIAAKIGRKAAMPPLPMACASRKLKRPLTMLLALISLKDR